MRNSAKTFGWAGVSIFMILTLWHGTSSAQEAAPAPSRVESDLKGMVGLGLVGAELGFVLPAVAGLHDTWAFIVFPVLGAAGGGAAGYYLLEQGSASPSLAVAALATGIGLIIPAAVITLSATAYDPTEHEQPPPSAPSATTEEMKVGGKISKSVPTQTSQKLACGKKKPQPPQGGYGMLRLSDKDISLGVPAITSAAIFSQDEMEQLHLAQQMELRVPIVSATF